MVTKLNTVTVSCREPLKLETEHSCKAAAWLTRGQRNLKGEEKATAEEPWPQFQLTNKAAGISLL